MNIELLCPSCRTPMSDALTCSACGYQIDTSNDVHDLRVDKSFDTHLDVDAYNQSRVLAGANKELARTYLDMIGACDAEPRGNALEIGCGPGNLTMALLQSGHFDTITAGDISANFMSIVAARQADIKSDTVLQKALFDANALPFADEQFDFVFGNSVLHHFAHFENTIDEARRVLKPGGIALFGEPIMETAALVSLAAGIMIRFFEKNPKLAPDRTARAVLSQLQKKTGRKMANLAGDRDALREVEDKFQFPLDYLRQLSRDLGYSDFRVHKAENLNFGQEIKRGILRTFQIKNVSYEFLDDFDFLFAALAQDYGRPMQGYLHPIFSYVAFVK